MIKTIYLGKSKGSFMFLTERKDGPCFLKLSPLPFWTPICSRSDVLDMISTPPQEVVEVAEKFANGKVEVVLIPADKGVKEHFVLRDVKPLDETTKIKRFEDVRIIHAPQAVPAPGPSGVSGGILYTSAGDPKPSGSTGSPSSQPEPAIKRGPGRPRKLVCPEPAPVPPNLEKRDDLTEFLKDSGHANPKQSEKIGK